MSKSFPKYERLCGVKSIERLHTQGKAFIAYPFRVVFLLVEDESETVPVRTMVSISKKKLKKAVDRNRVKRLMREAYRLNKSELIEFAETNKLKVHLAFQYIANEIMSFAEINPKMQKALEKLQENIAEKV